MTYDDLKAMCDGLVDRVFTDTQFASFLTIVRGSINRNLRISAMMTRMFLQTGENEYRFKLPADFLALHHVYVDGVDIGYVSIDMFWSMKSRESTLDVENVYTMDGDHLLLLPTPNDNAVSVNYFAGEPTLTKGGTATVLSTRFPDIYGYAALAECFAFVLDDARENKYRELFLGATKSIQQQDDLDKWTGSSMQIRGA